MGLYTKGAYLFKKDNDLLLMIYAELDPEELQRALPLSDTTDSTHIKAYFVNFTDFLGCSTQYEIEKEICDNDMISIYDENVYKLGDQQEVHILVNFAKIQLSHLTKTQNVTNQGPNF